MNKAVPPSSVHRWFLGALAVIPLVFTTATIDPVLNLRAALLGLLTFAALWVTRKNDARTPLPLIFWGGYAIVSLISISVAKNMGEAIYASSFVLVFGVFFFATLRILTREMLPALFQAMTLLGILLSIVGICQFFDIGFGWIPGDLAPYGTMTVKNLLSSFLFLLLSAQVYVALSGRTLWSILGITGIILSLSTMLMAQTRAASLACVIATLLVIVLLASSR